MTIRKLLSRLGVLKPALVAWDGSGDGVLDAVPEFDSLFSILVSSISSTLQVLGSIVVSVLSNAVSSSRISEIPSGCMK